MINPLQQFLRFAQKERWNVGVVDAPIHEFLGGRIPRPATWMPEAPGGDFVADPFGVPTSHGTQLFVESYDARSGRARIDTALFANGRFGPRSAALTANFHLSYPFLLQWENETYCIPECWATREVTLYRATGFPHSWEKIAVLIRDFEAVDATPLHFDGRWWLFCTEKRDRGSSRRLYIFHAAELLGPWRPHAGNPVKLGTNGTRPGGTPFVHEGKLYRPTQDNSRTYGGRIAIQRVLSLTTERFAEETTCYVEPDTFGPYPHGLHTLSAAGRCTLIDGKRFSHPRLAGLQSRLSGVARNLR